MTIQITVSGQFYMGREHWLADLSTIPSEEMALQLIAKGMQAAVNDRSAKVSAKFGKGNSKTPEAMAMREAERNDVLASIADGTWTAEISDDDRLGQLFETCMQAEARKAASNAFTRLDKDKNAIVEGSGQRPADFFRDKSGNVLTLKEIMEKGIFKRTAKRIADCTAKAEGMLAAENARKAAEKAAYAASQGNGHDDTAELEGGI